MPSPENLAGFVAWGGKNIKVTQQMPGASPHD